MNRCIMIVPKFDNMDIINKIRRKYDPVEALVAPHITLVFPFESDLTEEEIKVHVENAIKDIKPFDIELQGIVSTESFDNLMFLDVKKGNEELEKLHESLYTGILQKYRPKWLANSRFKAHMTVGKVAKRYDLLKVLSKLEAIQDVFKATITEVVVEVIGKDSSSIIENVIQL
ncbi:MAG: 2'-5' RNA ligase family protein [Sarcina sp.]